MRMSQKNILLLTGIFLAGLAARLIGITWGLPYEGRHLPWHPDENTFMHSLSEMNPSRMDFNPRYFRTPSLTIYETGAGLFIASKLGFLKIVQDEGFYHDHPEEWRKFFLVARLIQTSLGTLSILAIFLLGRLLMDERLGLWAAAFWAISPGAVIFSHYATEHTAVVLWLLLSLSFILRADQSGKRADFWLAGGFMGLAASTSYAAGPLGLVWILFHLIRKKNLERKLWEGIGFSALFFFLGTPYALLDLEGFWKDLNRLRSWILTAGALPLHVRAWKIFGEVLPLGVGAGVYLLGWISLVRIFLKKDEFKIFLLPVLWLSVFTAFSLQSNVGTSIQGIGRHLCATVIFALLCARLLTAIKEPKRFWLGGAALLISLLQTVSVDHFFLKDRVRVQASEWILSNISKGSKIGVSIEPDWFSPDVVFKDYYHPEKARGFYKYIILEYDDNRLKRERPDWLVFTNHERTYRYKGSDSPTKEGYMRRITEEKEYLLAHQASFQRPRPLRFFFPKLYPHLFESEIWIYKRAAKE